MIKQKSLVALADREVGILQVLSFLGGDLHGMDGLRSNLKVYCPFGDLYHSDGGVSPALRVYSESNTGFCFAETQLFTPTSLFARGTGLTSQEAARELLDRVNYRPVAFIHLWEQAQVPKIEIDRTALGGALKEYCSRICRTWEIEQFEEEVAVTLGRCLRALSKVETATDVETWLETCKQVMEFQLEGR